MLNEKRYSYKDDSFIKNPFELKFLIKKTFPKSVKTLVKSSKSLMRT